MGWAPEFCMDFITDAGQKWPMPVGGMVCMPMNSTLCKGWCIMGVKVTRLTDSPVCLQLLQR